MHSVRLSVQFNLSGTAVSSEELKSVSERDAPGLLARQMSSQVTLPLVLGIIIQPEYCNWPAAPHGSGKRTLERGARLLQ